MRAKIEIIKGLLPNSIRQPLSVQYHNYYFRRAMRRILKDPQCLLTENNIIDDLIYGWGNEDWSALQEFLSVSLKYALISNGPILECGSGLTTLVVGIIAQRTGIKVWSLEHEQKWGQKVQQCLAKYDIKSVELCVNPLRHYGNFDWYDPPLDSLPEKFTLVICDGPPAGTRGGRYGLFPIMKTRLNPGCVILLDDAQRTQEQSIVSRWEKIIDIRYQMQGSIKPYLIIEMSGN